MTVSVENDGREAFYERDNRIFVEVATDSRVKELEARCDELLEALRELVKVVPIANETESQDRAKWKALAAITKAEGGK